MRDWLNWLLYLDTKNLHTHHETDLQRQDESSMPTEMRVPFLDKGLFKWVAWNVPPVVQAESFFLFHLGCFVHQRFDREGRSDSSFALIVGRDK